MSRLKPALALQAVCGGLGYGLLEILSRGYTHISMIIAGGICLPVLVRISKSEMNLTVLSLAGGAYITAIELATGCVVNLWLNLGVWDYSREAMHLLGQVCLRFSLLWCMLCAVVMYICRLLRRKTPLGLFAACKKDDGAGLHLKQAR